MRNEFSFCAGPHNYVAGLDYHTGNFKKMCVNIYIMCVCTYQAPFAIITSLLLLFKMIFYQIPTHIRVWNKSYDASS